MATETKRSGELKVTIGAGLLRSVEQYAIRTELPLDVAAFQLLEAGLKKLNPHTSGAGGKRQAET